MPPRSSPDRASCSRWPSDGLFFPAARRVHPKYRTPHVAIVALTIWSAILALSGTYEQLFTYVMFASILFSVAAGLALFRLRRTMPDRHTAVPDAGATRGCRSRSCLAPSRSS